MHSIRLVIILLLFSIQISAQNKPYIIVLGIAQDGGYPQAGCKKQCCERAWKDISKKRCVSSIALVNPPQNKAWIFDATPDFKDQLQLLKQHTNDSIQLAGIFLTHAHIGHYTGLVNLGREVIGTKDIPVYALPRMKHFLENNGPWSLLVTLNNIHLNEMANEHAVQLTEQLNVIPILVPHRDEFSETAGFKISYQNSSILFIPDIDKWEKWNRNIADEIKLVDYVFIDATFFSEDELHGKSLKEIPHPLVTESMKLLDQIPSKIYFIHLNHTNPLLNSSSKEFSEVKQKGFHVAEQGRKYMFK